MSGMGGVEAARSASGGTGAQFDFASAMDAQGGSGGGGCSGAKNAGSGGGSGAGAAAATGATAELMSELQEIREALQRLMEMLAKMTGGGGKGGASGSSGAAGPSGASVPNGSGGIKPVNDGANGLGGVQGPSDRIPDPTQDVREVALGGKTLRIGSDGSASAGEVDTAAAEIQRMYQASPTFRDMVDSAQGDTVTVTLGRRGDNTSWGGGGRVFVNLNNIQAGSNETFQEIVGHEMGHALAGLGHGNQLDSLTKAVGAEA